MAKSSFADPDFSLLKGSENRRAESCIREQVADYRRSQVKAADPNAKNRTPWKVVGKDEPLPPLWEIQRDAAGKVVSMKQLRRDPQNMDADSRFSGRRYVVEIDTACCVGGQGIEPGAKIDGYAEAAFSLHNIRGKIILEYPEV